VPLLVDPAGESIRRLRPAAVVDAILAKRNLGTSMDMAPLTVALGPGFEAGRDVGYVIETMRGHDLGRIITSGSAAPNTGVPGVIGGYGIERVIHAPAAGVFRMRRDIGSVVEAGEAVGFIETPEGPIPVQAKTP
jgi:xanthine dehydrogenase accessory factor